MVGEEDYPDEVEERLVNEEYKIWKKNTPFLYGRTTSKASSHPGSATLTSTVLQEAMNEADPHDIRLLKVDFEC